MKLLTVLLTLALNGCVTIDSASIEACDSDNNCLRGVVKFKPVPVKPSK